MYTKIFFFSLYKPIKKGPKIFFPLSKEILEFFFSRSGAAWNFFSPESGLQKFFFLGEGPREIFFLDFLRAPQIINGCPLTTPTSIQREEGNFKISEIMLRFWDSVLHYWQVSIHNHGKILEGLGSFINYHSNHYQGPQLSHWIPALSDPCFKSLGNNECRKCKDWSCPEFYF